MDADAIAQREAEELMKERRELQARLKSQEKKVPTVFLHTNCQKHCYKYQLTILECSYRHARISS